MASNENKSNALQRVASLAYHIIFSKLCSAVTYGAAANIYKPINIAAMELSSHQCLLLALVNSLVTGDVMFCPLLVNICQQVQQLRSKYLKVWLIEDFDFPREDMVKAITLLDELLAAGVMKLPSHIMGIMSSIAIKYGIPCVQLSSLSEEGSGDLAIKMEDAVSNNNAGDIITLVTAGGDVNRLTQSGDSFLHVAARTGNCSSIAVLGFLKADLEIMNSSMATPLEVAIRSNNVHSVRALLMAGAKVDKHWLRGDTYLHIAAAGSHNEALLALLEGGLEANVKNHFEETPLFQAVRSGNVRGVEILLERGADLSIVPQGSKNLVQITVESQNVAMFKVFVKDETLPALKFKDNDSLVHFVAESGNAGMLKILKDQRLPANIKNKNGVTPLHVASDISIVRMLLGMDLVVDEKDNTGCTTLMIAAKNSKPDIATFLLYCGANPNVKDNNNNTPLHYAAVGGCVDIVKALLDVGARVEEKNKVGRTPAFLAAINNKLNALELLIDHGVDLTLKDNNGEGMIHHAARDGHSEVVSVLLGSGVVVDVKAQGDRTPLHYAAEKGHVPVVSVLLNKEANVRALTNIITKSNGDDDAYMTHNRISSQTKDCWTPLIAAAKVGSLDVVKLLLDEGAPVNDRDTKKKRTALGWAVTNQHTSVADYLRSVGGTE